MLESKRTVYICICMYIVFSALGKHNRLRRRVFFYHGGGKNKFPSYDTGGASLPPSEFRGIQSFFSGEKKRGEGEIKKTSFDLKRAICVEDVKI